MKTGTFRHSRAFRLLVAAVALLLIEAIALFNVLPHMRDAIWQDEAYTLVTYVTRDGYGAFLDYRTPNNHVLFSAMLGYWLKLFDGGWDIPTLRLLPLLLFLASVPVTMLAAHRMGGRLCALVAGALFAASSVTPNFATQLRGYGPSWIFFAAMLWCALNVCANRRAFWRMGYLLACMGAVAMLPSNFFLAMVVAVAAGIYLLLRDRKQQGLRSGVAVLLLGPFLGFLAYAAVFAQLLKNSRIAFSSWTRPELLDAWLRGAVFDYWYLMPLVGGGLAIGLHQLLRAWRERAPAPAAGFVLALGLLAGLGGVIALMPMTPFPRTLVPFLPVWYCALGLLCVLALRALQAREQLRWLAAGMLVAAAALLFQQPIPSCRAASSAGGGFDYDLCYQYFHDRYEPATVLGIWAQLGSQDVPIVTDFEGYFALNILYKPAPPIFEYRSFPRDRPGPTPMVVVHDRAQLDMIARSLGLEPSIFRLVADAGYFDVYATADYGKAQARIRPAR